MTINWLAAVVVAVATFALGALWYSPLMFAGAWTRAHGYAPEQVEAMRSTAGRAYAVTLLCWVAWC